MKDDRRTLGRVSEFVHVEADRRHARDSEVPEWEILAESFHERENEATHAGIDVDIGGSLGPDAGEILDRVDHPMGVLRSGTDDENRSICDCVGRGVDVASVVIGARDKDDIESEVVGGFVKGGVGSVGEDDLAALDTSLGRARSRAVLTAIRIDSVPPEVMKPVASSPWSKAAIVPTTSRWIWPSDGMARVLSAFSWRYIAAASSAIACTSGPPS